MEAKQWAVLCHLCGLVGYIGNGIGSVIAPAVVWYLERETSDFVNEHGKEAINFNISISLYILMLIAFGVMTFGLGMLIVVPLMGAIVIFHVVCTLMAALKASQNEMFRYPLTIRLLK
ncbi:MAG: DUF4870 domain-containing protein [Planctomycetales bacterium]|nr:DUF4870 domain-containing protein [Planctomycetales bacterium]